MRIFVVTQDEPVYAPLYLRAILAATRHELVGVAALPPGGKRGFLALVLERRRMYGGPDFARAGWLYARARLTRSVARVCAAHGIARVPCTDVNEPALAARLRADGVDVLVSVAANQRFGPELLAAPRLAAVNLHSALLPHYRGLDGLFWALARGETTVGVTAHLMIRDFDAGGILGRAPFAVAPEATLHEVYLAAIQHGAALLARVLDELASGTAKPQPNDIASGGYCSAPTPAAVREFRLRGRRFFP